jgi:hypothetical protein
MNLRAVLLLLILSIFLASCHRSDSAEPPRESSLDRIYIKAPDGELGFKPARGTVVTLTRDYVVFQHQGADEPRAYTKQEVRRIELSVGDRERTRFADRYWNEEQRNLPKDGSNLWGWISSVVVDLLPGGLLIGLLILAATYLAATTALQGYERFVIEGNIKRLNTAKLLHEIEKLKIEVIEMRRRLDLPVHEDNARSLESAPAIVKPHEPERAAETRAGAGFDTMQTAESRLVDFVKYKLLWLRTPARVSERKRQLVSKWERRKEHGASLLRVRYHFWSILSAFGVLLGWFFVAGSIGNVFMYVFEPAFRQELGGEFVVFIVAFAFFLTVAVLRLTQDRRLRRESYETVFPED